MRQASTSFVVEPLFVSVAPNRFRKIFGVGLDEFAMTILPRSRERQDCDIIEMTQLLILMTLAGTTETSQSHWIVFQA